ncbi:hypothetical protein ABZY03_15310, partial [Streptomyces klenkii]|uniref:hypothetical protein n=1 Tax=Streptomyces klenkii TaxID=1420899 RepID=UPI0033ADA533
AEGADPFGTARLRRGVLDAWAASPARAVAAGGLAGPAPSTSVRTAHPLLPRRRAPSTAEAAGVEPRGRQGRRRCAGCHSCASP